MSSAQGQRIEANCKIIWGSDCNYDLDVETDDCGSYIGFVKKDFGLSFGLPLMMTSVYRSSEAAWRELDRMLELWARQVKRGTPMTRDERLKISGGPRGKHRNLLTRSMDKLEKREGEKVA